MRLEPRDRAVTVAPLAWRTRLGLLPQPVRRFGLLLFLSALVPGAVEFQARLGAPRTDTAGALAWRPALAGAISLALAFAALMALERPRGLSLPAYVRQVRDRFRQVQEDFDGALRRRAHEEEEAHHVAAPIDHPQP
jgi:hypothetical protein